MADVNEVHNKLYQAKCNLGLDAALVPPTSDLRLLVFVPTDFKYDDVEERQVSDNDGALQTTIRGEGERAFAGEDEIGGDVSGIIKNRPSRITLFDAFACPFP